MSYYREDFEKSVESADYKRHGVTVKGRGVSAATIDAGNGETLKFLLDKATFGLALLGDNSGNLDKEKGEDENGNTRTPPTVTLLGDNPTNIQIVQDIPSPIYRIKFAAHYVHLLNSRFRFYKGNVEVFGTDFSHSYTPNNPSTLEMKADKHSIGAGVEQWIQLTMLGEFDNIQVIRPTSGYYIDTFGVERSDDGGASWSAVLPTADAQMTSVAAGAYKTFNMPSTQPGFIKQSATITHTLMKITVDSNSGNAYLRQMYFIDPNGELAPTTLQSSVNLAASEATEVDYKLSNKTSYNLYTTSFNNVHGELVIAIPNNALFFTLGYDSLNMGVSIEFSSDGGTTWEVPSGDKNVPGYFVINGSGGETRNERFVYNSIQVFSGTPWEDPGATATDTIDGDITAGIVTDTGGFSQQTPGQYIISYSSTNTADQTTVKQRTVNVANPPTDPGDPNPPDPVPTTSIDVLYKAEVLSTTVQNGQGYQDSKQKYGFQLWDGSGGVDVCERDSSGAVINANPDYLHYNNGPLYFTGKRMWNTVKLVSPNILPTLLVTHLKVSKSVDGGTTWTALIDESGIVYDNNGTLKLLPTGTTEAGVDCI